MSVSDYLKLAEKNNTPLKEVLGVIIYPDGGGIPQDVILLPYDAGQGKGLEEIVGYALHHLCDQAVLSYFQSIRWLMPDLEEQLKQWDHLKGNWLDLHYFATPQIRLSYGKITFDVSIMEDEPSVPDICREVSLNFQGKVYSLKVMELPNEMGVPKLFSKINFH